MSPDRSSGDAAGERPDLAARIRLGSTEALAEAYRMHGTRIFQLAFRITGNRADAEDVLQDVFLGLQTALGQYRNEGRFGSWLGRVAARTALMRLRRGRREIPLGDFEGPANAEGPVILDRVAAADLLSRLPESLRRVFLLKEVDGFSHREIGELLGISPGASEVRLHRAWRCIQDLMEGDDR